MVSVCLFGRFLVLFFSNRFAVVRYFSMLHMDDELQSILLK